MNKGKRYFCVYVCVLMVDFERIIQQDKIKHLCIIETFAHYSLSNGYFGRDVLFLEVESLED